MEKFRQITLFLFLTSLSLSAGGLDKLDPRLGLLVRYPAQMIPSNQIGPSLRKSAGEWQVEAIITFAGNPALLRQAGARLRCVYDDVAVATVPVSKLEELAALPEVMYVESSQLSRPYLDVSVPAIRGVQAREQFGVTGRGVIVGIIDSGIDWTHEDFRKADGSTRIKYLLDLSETGHSYGGRLYTEDDINDALVGMGQVSEVDESGHGTHVAGIAAGDGSSTAELGMYAGVAPEADLVVVKATRDAQNSQFETADQIIALAFIDSIAAVLNEPYVVNLSFGGSSGAHDGTSAVERFIDGLVGAGKAGKAVVTVAGNEGDQAVHARASLSPNKSYVDVTFTVDPYTPEPGSGNDQLVFDAWYDGSEKISVTLIAPDGFSYGTSRVGTIIDKNGSEGSAYIWNSFYDAGLGYRTGVNPFNGDREIYVAITDDIATSPPASGTWTLRFSGLKGTVDVYLAKATMKGGFVNGRVDDGKVAIPGTGKNSITVGAFVTKKIWTDRDGNRLTLSNGSDITVGDLALFSSPGPTRDGRIKPEITAPGQMIASAYSKDAPPTLQQSIFYSANTDFPNAFILQQDGYAIANGTSFAAPHVAGALALLLQKYPETTAQQMRNMLTASAMVDSRVGMVPNNQWGWGKLDIYSALLLSPGEEPPANYKLIHAYPNPFATITKIEFELPYSGAGQNTELRIFNDLGQQIRSLLSEAKSAGHHAIYWDGRDDYGFPVASGIYFIEMRSGSFRDFEKIVFLGLRK